MNAGIAFDFMISALEDQGVEIIGEVEKYGFYSYRNKKEFSDFITPTLDEMIESRVRIINMFGELTQHFNWILEYLYEQGLRRGDIICITLGIVSDAI